MAVDHKGLALLADEAVEVDACSHASAVEIIYADFGCRHGIFVTESEAVEEFPVVDASRLCGIGVHVEHYLFEYIVGSESDIFAFGERWYAEACGHQLVVGECRHSSRHGSHTSGEYPHISSLAVDEPRRSSEYRVELASCPSGGVEFECLHKAGAPFAPFAGDALYMAAHIQRTFRLGDRQVDDGHLRSGQPLYSEVCLVAVVAARRRLYVKLSRML